MTHHLSLVAVLTIAAACPMAWPDASTGMLKWRALPDLPDPLGRAGAFVGVHNDVLIFAGGANFPVPVWENEKTWHADVFVLQRAGGGYEWRIGGDLPRPIAYGACVPTADGLLCLGGNDGQATYAQAFLLSWDSQQQRITRRDLPPLPSPCAYGAAVRVGDWVYLAGGCRGQGLETAMRDFWRLDLRGMEHPKTLKWERLPPWPGPARAFHQLAVQFNGRDTCIYLIGGRHIDPSTGVVEFLADVYEFDPAAYDGLAEAADDSSRQALSCWRRRADAPRPVMAGTAIGIGQAHIFLLSGADGSLFDRADALRDAHPGFPKEALAYHTITDTWFSAGPIPANQVTTPAVRWGHDGTAESIIIASGEIRPRVRSPKCWAVHVRPQGSAFGMLDFSAIGVYLLLIVGVGVSFSFRNKNSDDFFRGGQRVPWLVAGLSIFATMLSSITFIAIPAKAFATDWTYFPVNLAAVAVAPLVIRLFLPFFRRIDATSAYEYLEKRFNRPARWFASASFVLFQIGRMAVVLYLPALVLAAIMPLSVGQCILLMGVLSIIYCTLGGLEAVVWTDTIQSLVLLGGALLSLVLILQRVPQGLAGAVSLAADEDKLHLATWDFSAGSFATTALWVVVLGGLGQQLVPYASDMAVVQRYMAVSDIGRARRAIWTNAVATIPASVLFFAVGTALFVFYKTHPQRLDPTFSVDAVFPLFIARELPRGIAGLVVAGIFAAAQSTISTSMNSIATALVTDFVRPLNVLHTERGYLRTARLLTLLAGVLGTALALMFASADIKSLWDQFMRILGLFGGTMCGLFCLGIFTTRANGPGAVVGAIIGAVGLFLVQQFTPVHLLLYAAIGIVLSFAAGYVASLLLPAPPRRLDGLTLHTLGTADEPSKPAHRS